MYLHQPNASDVEALTNAVHPKKGREHHLTTYSDECWGSKIGNTITYGVAIPLFKFWSMIGAIIYRMGGPILWEAIHQK